MSRYQITFTQTETQPVTVEAPDLATAQTLAAKHICRTGYWTLDRDRYIVDGHLVETARV